MEDDVYFLSKLRFAQPTLLYGLAPAGADTGFVESLHSYVLSLAHEHCVAPSHLVRIALPALISKVTTKGIHWGWDAGHGRLLVGCAESATAWTEVLKVATGRHDLRFSTLLPLSRLVCGTNLVDRVRRVCLACIERDVRAGSRSYGQLLWRIAEVTCCPEHGTPLVEAICTRGRAAGRARYRRISLFGVCGDCGSVGYRCSGQALPTVPTSPAALRFSRQCRELIAGVSEIEGSDPAKVKMALRVYADATGGIVQLADQACLPKSLLSRWLSTPSARLSLRAYFNLSEVTGYSMLELLSGTINDKPAGDTRGVARVRRRYKSVNKAIVASELVTTLESGGSIQVLQKSLGIDRKSLRSVSPEVYDKIVLRSQLARGQECQARRRDAIAQAKNVLIALLSRGLKPSLRNAMTFTERPWLPSEARAVALLLLRATLGDTSVRLPARASRFGQAFLDAVKAEAATIDHVAFTNASA